MTRISRRGLLTTGAAAGVLAASGMPLRAQAKKGGRLRAGLSGAEDRKPPPCPGGRRQLQT